MFIILHKILKLHKFKMIAMNRKNVGKNFCEPKT